MAVSNAPATMTLSQESSPELDAYRPAGVFISYASEDHDIAQATYQSLQALGETVYDRIVVFLDSKSIDGGNEIRAEIKLGLKKSDFLIVLYTGLFKRSHGYTGWEVGFFEGLMDEDRSNNGETKRRIIYLYSGEQPSIGVSVLGISINVDSGDLAGSRVDYEQKCRQLPDDPDSLARVYLDIASRAESRLPAPLNDANALDRMREKRRKRVAEEIIPSLKGKLFESMGKRVTRGSVEQKLIEFELPKPPSDQTYLSIPDDAKLTAHSGAFEIFSISQQDDTLGWCEFCREIKARDALSGSSILLAIEQTVISAVSPALRIDNDQILKAANGTVFRILVMRQLEYYNGRKVVQVYFVDKLQDAQLGNAKTSAILGFINLAAKYRFIFIERESPLSVESFKFEHDPTAIQTKARQLVRELLLIEEEARNLKLDQMAAITAYFGADEKRLAEAKLLQDNWYVVRGELMTAAETLLGIPPTSDKFSKLNEGWLSTLSRFRTVATEINSTATLAALDNLKRSIADSET